MFVRGVGAGRGTWKKRNGEEGVIPSQIIETQEFRKLGKELC